MVATYCKLKRGKSLGALEAENNGKYPITAAMGIVAAGLGISQRAAKAILKYFGPCEYHHTGANARLTEYYDPVEVLKLVEKVDLSKHLYYMNIRSNGKQIEDYIFLYRDAWDIIYSYLLNVYYGRDLRYPVEINIFRVDNTGRKIKDFSINMDGAADYNKIRDHFISMEDEKA